MKGKEIKNKIIVCSFVFIFILSGSQAFADTNLVVDVATDQDLHSWFSLEAGGDMETWINGDQLANQRDLEKLKEEIGSQGKLEKVIFGKLLDAIYSPKTGLLFKGIGANLNDLSRVIGQALYDVYLTRDEFNMRMFEYDIRQQAIEDTLDKVYGEEYCDSKINLMEKYNMEYVECYDGTHYRNGIVIGNTIPDMK